jgi:hypothetical protein
VAQLHDIYDDDDPLSVILAIKGLGGTVPSSSWERKAASNMSQAVQRGIAAVNTFSHTCKSTVKGKFHLITGYEGP